MKQDTNTSIRESPEIIVLDGVFTTKHGKPISYEIGSDGYVYSNSNWRGYGRRALHTSLNHNGYPLVFLMVNGCKKKFRVHTLMAQYFLPPRPSEEHQVRHLDGNKLNNAKVNLKWGTAQENADDRALHGNTKTGKEHADNVMKGRRRATEAKNMYKALETIVHIKDIDEILLVANNALQKATFHRNEKMINSNTEANARLIAAAPAMYAFIKEMAKRYEKSEWIAGEANEILNRINKH